MSEKTVTDLTEGAPGAVLFALTLPMLIGVSSSILVTTIEIGFIGQLGTDPLAAITFTFPVTTAMSSITLGIGIGCSSVMARLIGGGQLDAARIVGTHALLLVVIVSTALVIVGLMTIDSLFRALGASPDIVKPITSYLTIYYPGVVFFTVTMVASSMLRATGEARLPGIVMTVGACVNLGLDPILIFGLFGAPRMEIAGAATAITAARMSSAVFLLTILYRRELVHVARGFIRSCRQILVVGIPAIATQLIGPVSAAIITRLLAAHGEDVVAGFGVAIRIESAAVMFLFALSGSIGPFIGQNFGASRVDRVQGGIRAAYAFCIAWGAAAALALFLFGDMLAPLFDENPSVVLTAAVYLAIVPWSYGMWGVLMMASASFNALGRPIPSTVLSFTRMFIIYVPLAYVADKYWGYAGVFVATAMSNAAIGVAGYQWFKRAVSSQSSTL